MSRLGINTGSVANDGTGDSLRSAMGKINTFKNSTIPLGMEMI